MGLYSYEGFDHYNNSTDVKSRQGKLQWTDGAFQVVNTNRCGSGKSIRMGQSQYIYASLQDDFTTIILGLGFILNAGTYDQGPFRVRLMDGNTEQCSVWLNGLTAELSIYRGTTLLYEFPRNLYSINAWHFLEIKATINSTTGSVSIRTDSQPWGTTPSLNTQSTGNARITGFQLQAPGPATGWSWDIDDVYVNDTTVDPGLYPMNDFAGDMRCLTAFVVGNDSAQWTPLTGTNWQMVDETTFDGDATYNFSNTPGQEDRFNTQPAVNTVDQIIAIQVTGVYRKDVSGASIVKQLISSGGTKVYGTEFSVPSGYSFFTDTWKMDPNTGMNWTVPAANDLKIGYNLVSN